MTGLGDLRSYNPLVKVLGPVPVMVYVVTTRDVLTPALVALGAFAVLAGMGRLRPRVLAAIAGGAVVLSGAVIPPRSLVAGVPGKVRRELTDDEVDGIRKNAQIYLEHSRHHAESIEGDSV